MNIGLQLPSFTYPGGAAALRTRLPEIAQAAEAAGFASLWVMDHYYQLEDLGGAEEMMLEAYTTLGFLARATERIRLGVLVNGVIYRHPAALVKAQTTLDVLAGGRTTFGIGAAWYDEEARGLGFPWPPRAARYEMLEETLRLAKQMWSGSDEPFDGRHYQLERAICRPLPLAQPHPPIMVGGNGERKTLRLVAEYGDACNLLNVGPAAVRRKLDILRAHCERAGRDYETIERTHLSTVEPPPGPTSAAEIVAVLAALGDAGIQHAIVNMPDVADLRGIELFGREIIPVVS
jgi:F420-dependent oxidoreductase-like protein